MNAKKYRKLHNIYRKVPRSHCTGQCVEACGTIALSKGEFDHLTKITGEKPHLVGASCSLLKEGRCSEYRDRPLVCRLFGSVDDPALNCSFCDGPKISKAAAWKLLDEVQGLFGEPKTVFVDNQ